MVVDPGCVVDLVHPRCTGSTAEPGSTAQISARAPNTGAGEAGGAAGTIAASGTPGSVTPRHDRYAVSSAVTTTARPRHLLPRLPHRAAPHRPTRRCIGLVMARAAPTSATSAPPAPLAPYTLSQGAPSGRGPTQHVKAAAPGTEATSRPQARITVDRYYPYRGGSDPRSWPALVLAGESLPGSLLGYTDRRADPGPADSPVAQAANVVMQGGVGLGGRGLDPRQAGEQFVIRLLGRRAELGHGLTGRELTGRGLLGRRLTGRGLLHAGDRTRAPVPWRGSDRRDRCIRCR